jgi:hypothetical protein
MPSIPDTDLKRNLPKSSLNAVPFRLIEEIISRSVAGTWEEAKLEWSLDVIFLAEEPGTCLCGKFPIREMCVITNRLNGETAIVGNHCIRRFLTLSSDQLFASLRKIIKNPEAIPGTELVEFVHGKHWINDWERKFLTSVCQCRRLSDKQKAIVSQINAKIMARASEGR